MKKIVFGLCIMALFIVMVAGCGKSKPQDDATKGKLKGNVSTLVNVFGTEELIITKINKARVTVVEAGLYDDTDSSGNYFIPGITPGSYTVVANYAPGTNLPDYFWYSGGYELNGEDEVRDYGGEDPNVISVSNVTITAGVTTTLDFILYGY